MKKVFFLFFFTLMLSSVSFALAPEDNGYAWNTASYEEKVALCKELSKTNGKDYSYWIDMLNGFYSINNWAILSTKIKEVAAQIPLSEQPSGE